MYLAQEAVQTLLTTPSICLYTRMVVPAWSISFRLEDRFHSWAKLDVGQCPCDSFVAQALLEDEDAEFAIRSVRVAPNLPWPQFIH